MDRNATSQAQIIVPAGLGVHGASQQHYRLK
jgi:hypothetical protein